MLFELIMYKSALCFQKPNQTKFICHLGIKNARTCLCLAFKEKTIYQSSELVQFKVFISVVFLDYRCLLIFNFLL